MHHELTVWSRGIIMDKEARDVSTCIATAARKLGYYAENVSDWMFTTRTAPTAGRSGTTVRRRTDPRPVRL